MPLENEAWNIDKDNDKVAKMARSMSQDMGKRFKEEVLRKIYPKKDVKGIDVGLICTNWAYDVLTNLDCNPKVQDKLLRLIRVSYLTNVNLDKDELWLDYMAIYGIRAFATKIDKFAQIAKIAFMGQLDKPEDKGKDYRDVQW